MDLFWLLLLSVAALGVGSNSIIKKEQPQASALVNEDRRKCMYGRTHGLLAADCRELHLRSVPSGLSKNIEVLELTFNRIRELHNTSFVNYPSLQILYLSDNSISFIDAGAFEPLQYLEVLDLTLNSLHEVPDALNYLPSLRKLIVSSNPFIFIQFSEPLPSVEYLEISGCKLKELPDLKAFSRLAHLNVSNNRISSFKVEQIAPLCRLHHLDLRNNSRLFRNRYCSCELLRNWSSKREIKIEPARFCFDHYEADSLITNSSECYNNETEAILESSSFLARSCEFEVQRYSVASRLRPGAFSTWALIGLVVCLAILVLTFSVYCARRRTSQGSERSRRTDSSKEDLTCKKGRS